MKNLKPNQIWSPDPYEFSTLVSHNTSFETIDFKMAGVSVIQSTLNSRQICQARVNPRALSICHNWSTGPGSFQTERIRSAKLRIISDETDPTLQG